MGGRVALEAAADLETVDVGHHDVEQNEIAFVARAEGERLGAVRGGDHVEIFGGELRLQEPAVGRHVVDHEDPGCHWRSPCGAPRNWRIVSMNLATEIGFERYASQPPWRMRSSSPFMAKAVMATMGMT